MEANSAARGLELLVQTPCEVVVSDILMPGMDGTEFLRQVRDLYPKTIRIALSGHASQEMMLRVLSLSHQYFSKPCDTEKLAETIEDALRNTDRIADTQLKSIILHVNNFPLLPAVYGELTSALSDNQKGSDRIAEIIQKDPAMASKVMQVANSAFFGAAHKVNDLQEAATLIGTETIHAIALVFKCYDTVRPQAKSAASQVQIWEHSVRTAKSASRLIEFYFQKPKLKHQALTLSLLHDLGRLILADYAPGRYQGLIELAQTQGIPLPQIEEQIFEISHAELGAMLFKLWGLPEGIYQRVRYHHKPSQYGEVDDLLSSLYIANAHDLTENLENPVNTLGLDVAYLQKAGLSEDLGFWKEFLDEK